MSYEEGEARQSAIEGGCCYMFFVDRPAKFVINAQDIPCKCHHNLHSTFGRLLNHAVGKEATVFPRYRCVKGIHRLLFFTKRDLPADTKLTFDYGVRKGQFGEAMALSFIGDV